MTILTQPEWEKLLLRWTPMEHSGEVRLACSLIASSIAATFSCKSHPLDKLGIDPWAAAIGIDPTFLRQQMERSHLSDVPRPLKKKREPELLAA